MTETSDEELLMAYQRGNPAAFATLFARYRIPLFNFILRWTHDRGRAEELYQDTWTKVIERCDAFRGEAKFSTWLYSIARNTCIDHQRRMKLRRHRSLDAPMTDGQDPMVARVPADAPETDELANAATLRHRITLAVEALPSDQREVFLLRQLQGMRFAEIADVAGVSENTAKSRMRYALERIRLELGDLREP
ncbi:MAG: RNA polymerase sigma factor [Polyangiales bacterium]